MYEAGIVVIAAFADLRLVFLAGGADTEDGGAATIFFSVLGFVFTGNGGGGDDDVALLMLGMLVMVCLGCAAAPVLILRGDAAEGNGGAFS